MNHANSPAAANRMSAAPVIAGVVILLMLALSANIAINDSFGHGAGMDTFTAGTADPWQLFINLDLMAGLLLMISWMIWRERGEAVLRVVAWTVLFLWWGNIAVAAYILTSFYLSGGRADILLTGRRAGQPVEAGNLGGWASALCLVGAAVAALVMIGGLISVDFAGIGAFGYGAAFGSLVFALVVLALVPPRRASA